MAALADSKIDLKVIRNPYQVYVALLLVLEGLLGYWLHRAESGLERGFAGLLMTVILLGVVLVLKPKHAETAMSIRPPEKEATETEIAAPAPDLIPGPDRSYIIDTPPEGWKVRELTLSDWASGGLGVKDPATRERLFPSAGQDRDILVFEREEQISIVPVPGQTTIDGRKFPTALETFAPTQLCIIPLKGVQPPLFLERPIEHNFLIFVDEILKMGTISATHIESGVIRTNGRRYVACELQQKLQNAIVNGKEGQDLIVGITVFVIQGELHDHLLIMKYTIAQGDPEVEHTLQTLKGLVASFRPVKAVNADEERRKSAAQADKDFKAFLAENGEEVFRAEFGILLLRLQGVSLEDPETRGRVMKCLKPFEDLAKQTGVHDEKLDLFWKALHCAETGDATSFKTLLNERIHEAAASREKKDQAKEAALPTPDAGLPG